MPMPVTKDRKQPIAKLRLPSARRSTTGRAKVKLRITKRMPAIDATQAEVLMVASSNQFQRDPSSSTYSRVPRAIAIRAMPGVVGILEKRQIRFVDPDQQRGEDRYHDTRREVDVEQPVPVQGVGDPATDDRPQCRRDRGDRADYRGGIDSARPLEEIE